MFKRAFRASPSHPGRVGPPHPISHIRPVLYDPPSQYPAPRPSHPYSLSEFKSGAEDDGHNYELQYRLLRQQLDSLHQSFWFNNNTRFYAGKETILRSLPPTATMRGREEALSVFLRQWLIQEQENAAAYTTEWRRQNFQLLKFGVHVELLKIGKKITSFLRRSH